MAIWQNVRLGLSVRDSQRNGNYVAERLNVNGGNVFKLSRIDGRWRAADGASERHRNGFDDGWRDAVCAKRYC